MSSHCSQYKHGFQSYFAYILVDVQLSRTNEKEGDSKFNDIRSVFSF